MCHEQMYIFYNRGVTKIANLIQSIRQQKRLLQAETTSISDSAKNKVEQMS